MKIKRKIRPLGDVTQDLEPLLEEMVIDHQLQYHEVLHLILGHMQLHLPSGQEEFEDGSPPPKMEYKGIR